jgi:hypothetical protein
VDAEAEMPLPSNPQTFFLGGIFALSVLATLYLARLIILPAFAAELGDRQSHFEAARRHARAVFSLRGVSMSRTFVKATDDAFADVPDRRICEHPDDVSAEGMAPIDEALAAARESYSWLASNHQGRLRMHLVPERQSNVSAPACVIVKPHKETIAR